MLTFIIARNNRIYLKLNILYDYIKARIYNNVIDAKFFYASVFSDFFPFEITHKSELEYYRVNFGYNNFIISKQMFRYYFIIHKLNEAKLRN